jgi:hypothetical protein
VDEIITVELERINSLEFLGGTSGVKAGQVIEEEGGEWKRKEGLGGGEGRKEDWAECPLLLETSCVEMRAEGWSQMVALGV